MARVCGFPGLLSLQFILGGGLVSGDRTGDGKCTGGSAVRYVSSLLEKSGWCFIPVWVSSSSVASRLLAMLEASDLESLDDVMAIGHYGLLGRSAVQVYTDEFGVPAVAASKIFVASLEVSSSRLESASSCKLGVSLFMKSGGERWLRLPTTKMTGVLLARTWMYFFFYQGCSCKKVYVIFHTNI